MIKNYKIAVIIPCFNVRNNVIKVINNIDSFIDHIYIIDDCCPQKTGEHILTVVKDPRVRILRNAVNLGVGGGRLKKGMRLQC